MPGMDGFELLNEIRALGSDAGRQRTGYSDERLFLADRSSSHALRRFSGMPAEAIHSRQISGHNSECSSNLNRLSFGVP
jgi:hypothetical protein